MGSVKHDETPSSTAAEVVVDSEATASEPVTEATPITATDAVTEAAHLEAVDSTGGLSAPAVTTEPDSLSE